ncbi:MAG: formate/nitrite transporter family protein [Treponema sp.]|nr:formate/nitrite transporter family protein [Treponema sp.]
MNTPAEIARTYLIVGAAKTRMPFLKLLMLSIFAGMFIAFGALGSTIVSCGVQPQAIARLLSAAIFPIGLMMVVVAGAELFTGNCLILVPVLARRASVKGLLYNWLVVYFGNFIGGVLIAFLAASSHTFALYGDTLAKATVSIAVAKLSLSFGDAFIRGILCNVMVCIAVWVSFAAKDITGKISALYLPVLLFVLCGFEHCIANMYFVPAGIFATMFHGIDAPVLSWSSFIIDNLIPVTLGNIAGGSVVVGGGYWLAYLKGSTNY